MKIPKCLRDAASSQESTKALWFSVILLFLASLSENEGVAVGIIAGVFLCSSLICAAIERAVDSIREMIEDGVFIKDGEG